MTKDEALDKALNALLWANIEINDWRDDAQGYTPEDQPQIMEAITAIKQALAAPVKDNSNYRLDPPGLDPAGGTQVSKVWWDGDKLIAKPIPFVEFYKAAPDLQAELEATNRQVEILSDALAESRREVAALKANAALDKKAENARGLGLDYEPVGWWDSKIGFFEEKHFDQLQPLYTTPPAAQRQWVGLTDEERDEVLDIYFTAEGRARAIEAKLKEKNNG